MKTPLFILLCISLIGCSMQDDIEITAEFPGGNIELVKTTTDTIWLKPDLSETEGEWFYWYYKVSGISDRTITFQYTLDNQFTSFGPAYSLNDNHSWQWYGKNSVQDNSFTFTFSNTDTVAYFCTAFPYTESSLTSFIKGLKNSHMIETGTLAITNEKRTTEKLLIRPASREPSVRVLITARHHACEMMASYVLEGIIESILNNPELESLKEHVEFMIIPFMDKDGVENGDQGKNRLPRDHNRDYEGQSIYASTAALRKDIPGWSDGKLKIALDLHCPWIQGEYHEWIYMVGNADPVIANEQLRFNKLIEKNATGELMFRNKDFLPFGEAWNTGNNYSKGISFTHWAGTIDGMNLATSIEFPYANVLGTPVSIKNAREFGKAIAFSIQDYLAL